jgi:hypothetical protein
MGSFCEPLPKSLPSRLHFAMQHIAHAALSGPLYVCGGEQSLVVFLYVPSKQKTFVNGRNAGFDIA